MYSGLQEIMGNRTLTAAIISWILAQLIKFTLGLLLEGKADLTYLTKSGGMPSGHAALVSAVAWGIGREHGFYSGEFALAVVLAIIVMYDAAGVRQAVGIQARIMNEIICDMYHRNRITPVRLKEILGHTPLEVFAGALLGLAIAILV